MEGIELDWSYFRLERWDAEQQLMAPQWQEGVQDSIGPQDKKEPPESDKKRPTRTPTRPARDKATPTRTVSPTPTPEETPTPQQIDLPQFGANFAPVNYVLPMRNSASSMDIAPLPFSIPLQQTLNQTITYTYDSLYRLTAADYSNDDYFYYTYDAVGNRLTEETHLETNAYVYDDANRLASVNSVNYTFDDNGNLLNDGVSTYTYDAANRLTAVSGPSSATYAYNGLGDRLQQTVNSQTTTYVLDLNAGLTQVLDDGDNTYLYGLGRIAQVNTSTEYFMGDALGSVRQLTDQSGQITYASSYDSYGVVTSTGGASGSTYGYTGEQQDPTGMVYLRARYYAPDTGRFTSRDTWAGDANSPMSFDRWTYANGNPLRYIDSSGREPRELCPWWWNEWAVNKRVDEAEKYVSHTSNPMDTYTAAGIAIQCAGWDRRTADSGKGAAQISDNQVETPYGVLVGDNRGHGLRCYIKIGGNGCPECLTEQELNKKDPERKLYVLEGPHDQRDPKWAAIYMRRRIQLVTNRCIDCSSTDIFIAAGLAQNGPGFNLDQMKDLVNTVHGPRLVPKTPNGATIPWRQYWKIAKRKNTSTQLWRFTKVIRELRDRRWIVPDVDWVEIDYLSK